MARSKASPPEWLDLAKKLYTEGESLATIAPLVDCTAATVWRHLCAADVPMRRVRTNDKRGSYKLDLKQRARAAKLYQDGATLAEVGKVYGVTAHTVASAIRGQVTIRGRGGKS